MFCSTYLLVDSDVQTYQMNQDMIMVIYVPAAKREQKPVYINDDEYAPYRTILKLSFVNAGVKKVTEKSDRKKVTEKSDRKKVTEKTEKQMEQILSQMQLNVEYKVEEAAMWLNIGRTRARTLLKMLVADGKISETGATKMKRYRITYDNNINS